MDFINIKHIVILRFTLRILGALLILFPVSLAFAQNNLVRIQGKVIDGGTKEPVQANITYEKLPNFDDMGIARSNRETGEYKLFMLHDGNYRIKITASGYPPYTEEFTVNDEDADGILEKDFELASSGVKHEIIRLENLLFARGRADISPGSYPELNDLADMMKESPTIRIQLEGHTDFQGNEIKNLELSQARVEAVRDYLMKRGVNNKRILLKAFGGTQPLTRERSDEGRKKNRRVVVRILE